MIVTPKWVFVHVPKSAGTSATQALGGKTQGISTHTPLRCVDKGDRYAFGFVRNPWARMVSLYRFMCQKPFKRTDNFDQQMIRAMGFKRWLIEDSFIMQEDDHPEGEPWVMKTHWRGDGGLPLPPMQRRPQMWWLEGCDYIGRVEDFPHSWNEALERGGIKPRNLNRINTTKGGDWRAEYDDESRAFIAEHFAPDIEFGGYDFADGALSRRG